MSKFFIPQINPKAMIEWVIENKDKEINRLFGLENSIREELSDNYRRTVDFPAPGLDEKINESLVENSNNSKEELVDVISKIGGF
jgi:hypothetical protein